ncbi:MAG TPA: hypothetical protein VF977_12875 [Candidatus Binatia bacterium]
MNPALIVAIPLGLVVVGMILNSFDLGFDQPASSPEQDPEKRLVVERESFRKFFDRQRGRAVKRQKRIGQYGWLLIVVFAGASIWLYVDTVNKTGLSNRIAALQTMGTEEGKEMVLSVTQSDGNNVKYLIKLPKADKLETASKDGVSTEKVSNWELEKLGTALSIGNTPLALGVALKIAN